jgi:hypothetical protein
MELKVACQCGQNFKFDVEPVNGQMPFAVSCPACNADGTAAANALISSQFPPALVIVPPPPPIAPGGAKLQMTRSAPAPAVAATPPPLASADTIFSPPPIGAIKPISTDKKSRPQEDGEFSLVRGITGAVAGAGIGCAIMFAFWQWAHFRFPLMGIAVGAAAGYGARWLARGTDTTLGMITAVIAGLSVTGTYTVMYGNFAIFNIVSIVICAGVAYRASSK